MINKELDNTSPINTASLILTIERSYPFGSIVSTKDLPNAGQNKGSRIKTTTGVYFVREYRINIPDRVVAYEAPLLEVLANKGLPVPRVIRNNEGEFVSRMTDGRNFIIQSYIEGDFYPADELDLNDTQRTNAAKTLANFHREMQNDPPAIEVPAHISDYTTERFFPKEKAKAIWETTISAIQQKPILDDIDRQILAIAPSKIEDIMKLNEEGLNDVIRGMPSVLAHGDFTPQNLIFTGDEVTGIVDWELARIQPRTYELLRAVCVFCKSDRTEIFNTPLDIDKAKRFISAYEVINPLSQEEKDKMFKLAYIASLLPYYLLSSRYIYNKDSVDRLYPRDISYWNWWKNNASSVTQAVFGN